LIGAKAIALDANVLVLLVVGSADIGFIERHRRLRSVYTRSHFITLRALLEAAPSLTTTTHALTEASNHARQRSEPMRGKVMSFFRKLVEGIGEQTPGAREAAALPEFPRLGLTDCAFLKLDPDRYSVMTTDYDLYIALLRGGFEVANFAHLMD
jgi:hypothetical protein